MVLTRVILHSKKYTISTLIHSFMHIRLIKSKQNETLYQKYSTKGILHEHCCWVDHSHIQNKLTVNILFRLIYSVLHFSL